MFIYSPIHCIDTVLTTRIYTGIYSMQVSISKAAEMVNVTRATLYRHIDKKGISVCKDDDGNPKIDISELIRVYGDKVKTLDKVNNDNTAVTTDTPIVKQNNTPNKTADNDVEFEVLKERVKHLELNNIKTEEERKREREQFEDRVEQLQDTLSKAQENQSKTTLLLEHYTKEGSSGDWEKSIKSLEERIANQEKEAKEKSEAEAKEKEEIQKQLEEKETLLKEKEEALELEKHKSFIHRMLGK